MALVQALTLGEDLRFGTVGDDTFTAAPATYVPGGDSYNTLQTNDVLNGDEGNDTLFASLVGTSILEGSNGGILAPTLIDIENLNLTFTDTWNGSVTLDLTNAHGVESINITDTNVDSGIANISNVGDVANFTFSDTIIPGDMGGWIDINDSTAATLNLGFDNAGEVTGDWEDVFRVDFEDSAATEANISLVDSNVDLDARDGYGSSNLSTVNITSEGMSGLDINDNFSDSAITNVTVSGSGDLELDLEMGSGPSDVASLNATAFTGDLDLEMENVTYDAAITTGQGNDSIDLNGDIYSGATIITGAGHDDIYGEDAGDNVTIRTGAGEDYVALDDVGEDSLISLP